MTARDLRRDALRARASERYEPRVLHESDACRVELHASGVVIVYGPVRRMDGRPSLCSIRADVPDEALRAVLADRATQREETR